MHQRQCIDKFEVEDRQDSLVRKNNSTSNSHVEDTIYDWFDIRFQAHLKLEEFGNGVSPSLPVK